MVANYNLSDQKLYIVPEDVVRAIAWKYAAELEVENIVEYLKYNGWSESPEHLQHHYRADHWHSIWRKEKEGYGVDGPAGPVFVMLPVDNNNMTDLQKHERGVEVSYALNQICYADNLDVLRLFCKLAGSGQDEILGPYENMTDLSKSIRKPWLEY